MNKTNFSKIKKYQSTCSFAVWNEKNITDTNIVENSLNELRTSIVIVGLNATKNKMRPFGNFHGKEIDKAGRGNRDKKVCEAFNKSKFRGAYMTDIFKSDYDVILKITPQMKAKAFKEFEEELKYIGAKNSVIIAIGKKVEILLHECKWIKNKIYGVRHFAYKGGNEFIKDVKLIKLT